MSTCIYCHATSNQLDRGFDRDGQRLYRCGHCDRPYSPQSSSHIRRNSHHPIIKCINCGRETKNPKFCSKSCAATYNNRVHIKRTRKPSYCKSCGTPVAYRRTTCDECNPSIVDWSSRTLGELRVNQDYQANARIRQRARVNYRLSDRPKYCERCGYDKYYEVCHIRAISDFPDDAMVTDVNDLSNLLGLCPNCHWEFDHGLLRFENGGLRRKARKNFDAETQRRRDTQRVWRLKNDPTHN